MNPETFISSINYANGSSSSSSRVCATATATATATTTATAIATAASVGVSRGGGVVTSRRASDNSLGARGTLYLESDALLPDSVEPDHGALTVPNANGDAPTGGHASRVGGGDQNTVTKGLEGFKVWGVWTPWFAPPAAAAVWLQRGESSSQHVPHMQVVVLLLLLLLLRVLLPLLLLLLPVFFWVRAVVRLGANFGTAAVVVSPGVTWLPGFVLLGCWGMGGGGGCGRARGAGGGGGGGGGSLSQLLC
jgi:hypothetical protein